jgi:thiamine-phosphate pyrophosphorylase
LHEANIQFPNTKIVAIGGITLENAKRVLDAGANMIAVCHSLFAADNIETQAKLFNKL